MNVKRQNLQSQEVYEHQGFTAAVCVCACVCSDRYHNKAFVTQEAIAGVCLLLQYLQPLVSLVLSMFAVLQFSSS